MSETAGGREPEAQPGHDTEEAEDELGHRDAAEDSGYDDHGEESDENSGSSPAW